MKKSRMAYDRLKRRQKWISFLFFIMGILITSSIIATIVILYPKHITAFVDKELATTTVSSTSESVQEIRQTSDVSESQTPKPTFVPRTNFENQANTPLLYKPLKDALEKDIAARELSGTLLAIKDNQVVLYNSFGYATEVNWKPQDSTYMIASLQKLYTAILISNLISENKLSLNTKLSDYFPEVEGSQNITIDSMLAMTSGLNLDLGKTPGSINTVDKLKEYILKNVKYTTNNTWIYSPVNFSMLAMIIEKITGKTYQEYLKEVITEPLNLQQTGFYTDLSDSSHLVPVREEDGSLRKSTIPEFAFVRELGTGNMFVSPKDFAIVMQALMDGKFGNLSQIVSMWTRNDVTAGTTYYKSGLYRQIINPNQPTGFYGHGVFRGYEPVVCMNNDASDMIIYFSNQHLSNKSNQTAAKEFYDIISNPVTFTDQIN